MSIGWEIVDPRAASWQATIDAMWAIMGAPHNPALLPAYFVKTAFVQIGGRVVRLADARGSLLGVGLLFPRAILSGRRIFTLRLHALAPLPADDAIGADVERLIAPDQLRLYRPEQGGNMAGSHTTIGGFDIGAPEAAELPAIRAMHRLIWGAEIGYQYPDDLHSPAFGPGTSLVARVDGRLVGFLLGFYRFGGLAGFERAGLPAYTRLSIESQVMGVAHDQRRAGLAAMLKRAQARDALARGVEVIHWTADPLQFPNAVLNFAKLRAVAGEFRPAYYAFKNELNRLPASRLAMTWLPASAWGRPGLAEPPPSTGRDLARFPGCVLLNKGPQQCGDPGNAQTVAIEIPADWTALQRDDETLAVAWRAATDSMLADLVGFSPGRYIIADAASAGGRCYLIAHPYDPAMFAA